MKKLIMFLICLLTINVSTAYADDRGEESLIRISADGRYIGSADFDNSNGGVQITSGQLELGVGDFSLSYQADKYSWNDKASLPFGNGRTNPWNTLHKLELAYGFNGEINRDWGYMIELSGSSAFEEDLGGYGAALIGGFGYAFNENWSARFGARLSVDEIETSILPFLAVSYEDIGTDGSGAFMTFGLPSTEVGYAFNESHALRAAFDFEGDTYRLKDDSTVARKGYVETGSMILGLYYDWQATDSLSLSIGPEYHFGREMQIYDEDGDKMGDSKKLDSAVGGILKVTYSF